MLPRENTESVWQWVWESWKRKLAGRGGSWDKSLYKYESAFKEVLQTQRIYSSPRTSALNDHLRIGSFWLPETSFRVVHFILWQTSGEFLCIAQLVDAGKSMNYCTGLPRWRCNVVCTVCCASCLFMLFLPMLSAINALVKNLGFFCCCFFPSDSRKMRILQTSNLQFSNT